MKEEQIEITGEKYTLDQLIDECKIDLDKWAIKDFELKRWDSYREGKPTKSWAIQLRGQSKILLPDLEQMISNARRSLQTIDKYDLVAPTRKKVSQTMVEIVVNDLHLGSFGEEKTDDESYLLDLLEAVELLRHEISKIRQVHLITVALAGDLFHVDSTKLTTTKGTFVGEDFDGQWSTVLRKGFTFFSELITILSRWAPINVVIVPGNHDYHTTHSLGLYLEVALASHPTITVDSVEGFKYTHFGNTLIGFCHGDKITSKTNLPAIMATAVPELWAKSKFREVHHGDKHAETVRDDNGVLIRCLPALCSQTPWEYSQGYRRQRPHLKALVWDAAKGLASEHNIWI